MRTPDGSDVFIPEAKMLRFICMLKALHTQRLTLEEIQFMYDITERTAYRYIRLAEGMAISIEKDFKGRYFIAEESCPFCGSTTNNPNES